MDGRPAMITRSPACRPGGQVVNVGKAGGHAGERRFRAKQLVDAIHGLGQQRIERLEGAAAVADFADFEDAFLGLVEYVLGATAFEVIGRGTDLAADMDQPAQNRAFAHDRGVGDDIGGAGGVVGERAKVGKPAGVLEVGAFSRYSATVTTSAGLLS